MEIHRIEICNINSIKGEYPIDFMSGQLEGQDLFAITGKTGSGKSTILDAITLALYNKVPRLDGKTGKSEEKSKDPYRRLKPEDTENCLTRGEKRGYAKVVFEASGKLYKAEWICELKNIKFTGSHSLYLVEHVSGIEKTTLLKANNLKVEFDRYGRPFEGSVAQDVVELIGLGYDQFCKSCILAQNSFANFLKASDEEKTDILEKITGTSIYGKIAEVIVKGLEEAITEQTKIDEKVAAWEADLIKDPNDPDKLQKVIDEESRLKKDKKELMDEIKEIDQGLEWWKISKELNKKKTIAEKNKQDAEKRKQDLLPKHKRIVRHDMLVDGVTLFDAEANTKNNLRIAEENVTTAKNALSDNKHVIEKKEKDVVEMRKTWLQKKEMLNTMEWIGRIKENITFIQSEYQGLNNAVEDLRMKAVKYDSKSESLKEKDLLATVKEWTMMLSDGMTLDDVQTKLESIRQEVKICANAADLFPKMENVLELNRKDIEDGKIIEDNKKEQERLQTEVEELGDLIRTLENADLASKRSRLEEGKPCELCGAIHHPYATEATINKVIDDQKKHLEAKKEEKSRIDEKVNGAKDRMNIRKGTKDALEQDIIDLKKRIENVSESFQTVFSKYSEDNIILELRNKAEQEHEWVEKEKRAVTLQTLIAIHEVLVQAVSHRHNLDAYLPEGWYEKRLEDKERYFLSLNNDINQYTIVANEIIETEKTIREYESSIETLKGLIPDQEKGIQDKNGQLNKAKEEYEKAVLNLSIWIKDFNDKEKNPVSREELNAQKEDKTNWIELREEVNDAEKKYIHFSTLYNNAKNDINDHSASESKPSEDEGQLKDRKDFADKKLNGSKDGNDEEGVANKLSKIERELFLHKRAEDAIADLKDDLKTKKKKVEIWGRFYEMLSDRKGGDKNAKDFRRNAQNYTLGLLLEYANKQLEKFTKRFILKKQNDSTLEIMVVDGELGERYASSLSGGETFMVSLALALGLSNISSGSVSIKNLFIDEGFGTLDTDTQKTVIGALNTLRTQGKRVGLISHTAALIGDESIYKIRVERKEGEKFSQILLD